MLPRATADNPADQQVRDILSVMQRNAFEGLNNVLHDSLTALFGPNHDAAMVQMHEAERRDPPKPGPAKPESRP
jgi:hypothetical protein